MPKLTVAHYMHIGLRENQEDSLFLNGTVVQKERYPEIVVEKITAGKAAYAVCDGMGGHERGEWASRFACERLKDKLPDVEHPGEAISGLIKEIQWEFAENVSDNTGTTIAGVVIEDDRLTVFNAGDSRVYRIGPDGIEYLSHDHSLVQEEVDRGHITADEAFTHPYRNIIGFGLGAIFEGEWHKGEKEPYVAHGKLRAQDCYLVCSDGVNDVLRDREILSLLAPDPFGRLAGFVEALMQRMNDNFSFILIGKT